MAGRAFAAGADPTIADVASAPFLHMDKYANLPKTDFSATIAYAERMFERPAMKKFFAAVAEAFRNHIEGGS